MELLRLILGKVLQHILCGARKTKKFRLNIVSSPDITHIDQISIVLRYQNKGGEPQECLIKFVF